MEPTDRSGDLTSLLRAWSAGDEVAFELPLIYDELHRMAVRHLSREHVAVSIQPTALVDERCLRVLGWDEVRWQSRGHPPRRRGVAIPCLDPSPGSRHRALT